MKLENGVVVARGLVGERALFFNRYRVSFWQDVLKVDGVNWTCYNG